MRRTLVAGLLLVISSASQAAEEPKVTELTIHPAAIDSLPFKYRLLPAEADIKSGNAVPILLRMPWEQNYYMNGEHYKKLSEWQTRPLEAPEWNKFPEALPARFYREMKRAAHRREANWEYPIGEEPAYFILLPDVQGLRQLVGFGLSAKARFHLSRGEFDEARECILVGLANARHVAQTPFFVNQLVATAICRMMFDQTLELMAQPRSPNLYWALSTLPDSLLQLHRAANLESRMFAMTFEAANELDRPRSETEWQKMALQLAEVLDVDDGERSSDLKSNGILAMAVTARKELPEILALSKENLAAMSDAEVSVRWYVHKRTSYDQRAAAVISLKPIEAWPHLKILHLEAHETRQSTNASGIDFVPTYLAIWSLNRKIQALRIVEAIRDHLASHDGKFPAAIAEITAVPIPLDPLTELPFEWNVDGNVATLRAPPLPVDLPPSPFALYEPALEFRIQTK